MKSIFSAVSCLLFCIFKEVCSGRARVDLVLQTRRVEEEEMNVFFRERTELESFFTGEIQVGELR